MDCNIELVPGLPFICWILQVLYVFVNKDKPLTWKCVCLVPQEWLCFVGSVQSPDYCGNSERVLRLCLKVCVGWYTFQKKNI